MKARDADGVVTHRYRFRWPDGREKCVAVRLDAASLARLVDEPTEVPDWTHLSFHKCPNCPLSEETHPRCPVARSLLSVVAEFKTVRSVEQVEVTVESPGRTYVKQTTAQGGVSPLLGLCMTTAGCPILDRLRPMVHTHLPFMGPDETSYRMISMYLVAQLLRTKRGLSADWSLERLVGFLQEIRQVNMAFCRRLNAAHVLEADASVNAVVILDTLGAMTGFSIADDDMSRLEALFEPYL